MIRTLYLAGPDVFRPDADAHARQLQALCARYGFEGLFPLDAQLAVPAAAGPGDRARAIYQADIGLLERADAVLANLDFFRGAEPDSGTCFEIGYAVARGKPVYGYVPEGGSWAERIRARHPKLAGADATVDVAGWELEEFGLPVNLMLAVPAVVVAGGAEAALQRLRADQEGRSA
jgi:Nucleoside 2-deoxyribosyltransferase